MRLTSDGLGTPAALLGEEVSETIGAVGSLITRGELLTSKHPVAVGAGEAVTVEGSALVRDASLVDHLQQNTPLLKHQTNIAELLYQRLAKPISI